jgi:hypothetical protein
MRRQVDLSRIRPPAVDGYDKPQQEAAGLSREYPRGRRNDLESALRELMRVLGCTISEIGFGVRMRTDDG